MKNLLLILSTLTILIFGCKKDEKNKGTTTYTIYVNVANGVNFSLYEPNSKSQDYLVNNLKLNASTSIRSTYDNGAQIDIIATVKGSSTEPVEMIINKSTGEQVFQQKTQGVVKAKITVQ